MPLRVVQTPDDVRASLATRRGLGAIGLVPTMGALHAGHARLIERARADCSTVVVSIFVNPLQFAAGEDYDRYPRQLEQDLRMAESVRVGVVVALAVLIGVGVTVTHGPPCRRQMCRL